MEFKRFPELLAIGLQEGKKMIAEWVANGKLPTGTESEITARKVQKRGQSVRRNSI